MILSGEERFRQYIADFEAIEQGKSNMVDPHKLPQMTCRLGCGACCIAPSISSPLPGMPQGKPAGAHCVQLLADLTCAIYGSPERPSACASFPAMAEHCGTNREEALGLLEELERLTRTGPGQVGRL
jgi:hypothetical protein